MILAWFSITTSSTANRLIESRIPCGKDKLNIKMCLFQLIIENSIQAYLDFNEIFLKYSFKITVILIFCNIIHLSFQKICLFPFFTQLLELFENYY